MIAKWWAEATFKLVSQFYNLVDAIFELMMDIGLTPLFSNDMINTLANRMYVFLSAYMVIRISIILLQYIANPESHQFKDANSQNSILKTLFGRIISVVILVAFAPSIFVFLHESQEAIILTIPQIFNISNTQYSQSVTKCTYALSNGKTIEVKGANGTCSSSYTSGTITGKLVGSPSNYTGTDIKNGLSSSINKAFLRINPVVSDKQQKKYQPYIDDSNDPNYYENILAEIDKKDLHGNFIFDLRWFAALITSLIACYMLIMNLLKIAMRTIKLAILEIIAPLAIMAFVDPSKGLDDKSFTGRYVKLYMATYLEYFVIMVTVSLVMLGITAIGELGLFEESMLGGLIILFALLKGMNDLPPMIVGLFGGDASKAGGMGILGKAGAAITGGLAGAAGGAGKGLMTGGLKGAAGGALSGLGAGAKAQMAQTGNGNQAKDKASSMSGLSAGAGSVPGKTNLASGMERFKKALTKKGATTNRDAAKNKLEKEKAKDGVKANKVETKALEANAKGNTNKYNKLHKKAEKINKPIKEGGGTHTSRTANANLETAEKVLDDLTKVKTLVTDDSSSEEVVQETGTSQEAPEENTVQESRPNNEPTEDQIEEQEEANSPDPDELGGDNGIDTGSTDGGDDSEET